MTSYAPTQQVPISSTAGTVTAGTVTATAPGPVLHHFRAAGVSVVLDARGPRLPRIVHWGADLGELDSALLSDLALADVQAVVTNVPDDPIAPSILTEHATGWSGLPGLLGHRGGRAWSTLFSVADVRVDVDPDDTQRLVAGARDDAALLAVTITVELSPQGVLRTRAQSDRPVHRPRTDRDALHTRWSDVVTGSSPAGGRTAGLCRPAPAGTRTATPTIRYRCPGEGQPARPNRRGCNDTGGGRHPRLRLRGR